MYNFHFMHVCILDLFVQCFLILFFIFISSVNVCFDEKKFIYYI